VATAVFWLGMEAVFSVTFSGMIILDDHNYGAIGVVFALMSWLIAIGVVRTAVKKSREPPQGAG